MSFLRSPYGQLVGLLVLVWLLYGKTLGFDFVLLDDPTLVLENQILQSWTLDHCYKILNPFDFRKQLGTEYLPLRDFSYLVDFYFWEKNPFGYHLSNLIFFSLGITFLFLFLRGFPPTQSVAFLATLLFILHPIHVESVVWISARKDVMALCFFMLSLWIFPEFQRKHFKRNLFLSWLFFLCALLSKMTTVILPAILWMVWRSVPWSKKIFLLPHFLLSGGFAILSILIGQHSGTVRWGGSFLETLASIPAVLLGYWMQLLFPVALNCYYELLPIASYPLFYSFCGFFVMGILLSLWRFATQYRFPLYWFLWTFLPVSHIIPIPFFKADRYMLLPSLGFCLGFALFWQTSLQRYRRFGTVGLGVVVFCWFVLTWNYSSAWKDSISLGRYTVSQAPNLLPPRFILADAYLQEKRYEEAAYVYEVLLQKSPGLWKAWFNLSRTYHFQEERQKELEALQKAYELTKDLSETVAQHGLTRYRKDGVPDNDVSIGVYVGSILTLFWSEHDEFLQARAIAHEIYKKVPLWPQAPYLLGVLYSREGLRTRNAGHLANADGFLQKALHLNPSFAEAHAKICEVYWHRGEYSKFREHFQKAYDLYLHNHQTDEAQTLLEWSHQFK